MRRTNDQTLARMLLDGRACAFSGRFFLRQFRGPYLRLSALAVLVFVGLAQWPGSIFLYFLLGMLAGCLLRDVAWVRSTRRGWPFREKVTDWDKVRRLAAGESVD